VQKAAALLGMSKRYGLIAKAGRDE